MNNELYTPVYTEDRVDGRNVAGLLDCSDRGR
jgi:hypothetical protein